MIESLADHFKSLNPGSPNPVERQGEPPQPPEDEFHADRSGSSAPKTDSIAFASDSF